MAVPTVSTSLVGVQLVLLLLGAVEASVPLNLLPYVEYYEVYPDPNNHPSLTTTQATVATAAMFVVLALGSLGFLPLNLADVADRIDRTRLKFSGRPAFPELSEGEDRLGFGHAQSFGNGGGFSHAKVAKNSADVSQWSIFGWKPFGRRKSRQKISRRHRLRYRRGAQQTPQPAHDEEMMTSADMSHCFTQIICRLLTREDADEKKPIQQGSVNISQGAAVFAENTPSFSTRATDDIWWRFCAPLEPACDRSWAETIRYGRFVQLMTSSLRSNVL